MSAQDSHQREEDPLRLPDNLWTEIYQWGICMEGRTTPRELTSEFVEASRYTGVLDAVANTVWPFPWNVTFVSSKWREVAKNSPTLWNDVYLSIPTGRRLFPSRGNLIVKDLQLILDRCSSYPITVEVCCLVRQPSEKAWAALLAHKGACVSWKLAWRPEEQLYRLAFTKRQLSQWHNLTSLDIELEPSQATEVPNSINFRGLKKLRYYKERGAWRSQTSVLLPLGSLESITLYLPFGYVGARLGPAPALRKLIVEVDQTSQWLGTNTLGITNEYYYKGKIYWPQLEELTIKNLGSLLRFAVGAPLRRLSVESNVDSESLQSMGPVLTRAAASIQELYIKGGLAWTDEVARCSIFKCNALMDMRIEFHLSTDDMWSMIDNRLPESLWTSGLTLFLEELAISRSAHPCPSLRSVEVDLVVQGQVSNSTWRWLKEQSKDWVNLVGRELGGVWESRLPQNEWTAEALDVCCLTLFMGSEPSTYSDVKLLVMP